MCPASRAGDAPSRVRASHPGWGGGWPRPRYAASKGPTSPHADAIAAVAKHYCAYGAVTAGREYASVDISDRTVREVHEPPFAAAVGSGVAAVMPAFTDLAGIPMTAHVGMLRGRLRETLGFDGVLVSDYNAIAELIQHGVAADLVEAAALALKAGVDIDMVSGAYLPGAAARAGARPRDHAQIDESVRRVLALKARLGLFEDPYRRGATAESATALAERRRLAREIGARSLVLLKQSSARLCRSPPACAAWRSSGPLADAPAEMCGPWWCAAQPETHVDVLAGIRAALPRTRDPARERCRYRGR